MQDKPLSVFTEKYKGVQKRIVNRVVLISNGIIDQAIAQWDTGASNTCISEEIVKKYNLIPISQIKTRTPSGSSVMNVYLIDLVLNNEIVFPKLKVTGTKIGAQGIDVLIGMDVISNGDFAISNYNGKTRFSFRVPSQNDIDFKEEFDEAAISREQ